MGWRCFGRSRLCVAPSLPRICGYDGPGPRRVAARKRAGPSHAGRLRGLVHASPAYAERHASAAHVTAVPEPETYAMLLAGLGVMGAVARRRKAKQA